MASAFLADLASQEPAIRGIGPTTTAAMQQFRRTGKIATSGDRATNGAAMRALPIGWVLPHAQADRRRQLTIEISRATHAAPAAVVAACVIATCASWALEGANPALLLEVAVDEARGLLKRSIPIHGLPRCLRRSRRGRGRRQVAASALIRTRR